MLPYLALFVLLTLTLATERSGHIDVLDSDTLQYYLQGTAPFAVVIFYYAQWSSHCQALSPYYLRIAELEGGSQNLIMAYFDCEADGEHLALCAQQGVQSYPTIQFVRGSAVETFPGKWEYTESIRDWIHLMLYLHKPKKNSNQQPLPIGIPPDSLYAAQSAEQQATRYADIAVRTSSFVDALLYPHDDWDAYNRVDWNVDPISSTCLQEAALDICQRLLSVITNEWVADQGVATIEDLTEAHLASFETEIHQRTETREPYCNILHECVRSDMEGVNCTPPTCPFVNAAACHYLQACWEDGIREEYRQALGLTNEQPLFEEAEPQKRKWGLFG